jgi:hypothetical protein
MAGIPGSPDALSLSRRVLRGFIVLNVIYAGGIIALLIASLVARDTVLGALGVKPPESAALVLGMRLIMVAGIGAAAIAHVVLARLLDIVETVRAGDPFIADNARRLLTIARAVLGLELLHLLIGGIARAASTDAQPLDIDWSFSFTRWIAVLLLFVLARVFAHGARMRADLEGTV